MEAILDRLRLGNWNEQQPRKTIRLGSDLEFLGLAVYDNPAERLLPPPAERLRIPRVNDRLLLGRVLPILVMVVSGSSSELAQLRARRRLG